MLPGDYKKKHPTKFGGGRTREELHLCFSLKQYLETRWNVHGSGNPVRFVSLGIKSGAGALIDTFR